MMDMKPASFRVASLRVIWSSFILSVTLYEYIGAYTSDDGKVRLVDEIRYASGRVEVKDRRWGTVCFDGFHPNVSHVICNQLGFVGGHKISGFTQYGSGRIALDNVKCSGKETRILQCRHSTRHNCLHTGDLGVQCYYQYDIAFCDFSRYDCGFDINRTSTLEWKIYASYEVFRILPRIYYDFDISNKFMFVDLSKGNPGDKAVFSNKTKIDIDKGSITFNYILIGGPSLVLNVFIGSGEKIQLNWSKSGTNERKWQFGCLEIDSIPIKDLALTFEAVRGSDNHSVVAVDDIGISRKPCEAENASCVFARFHCGYEIIRSGIYKSYLSWYHTRPMGTGPSRDHSAYSVDPGEGFMAVYTDAKNIEGDRTDMFSPTIHTNQSDKVEFYYYLYGPRAGNLVVEFVPNKPGRSNPKKHAIWEESGDFSRSWKHGCLELPPNQTGKIMFTAIVGTQPGLNFAIDDVYVSQGRCQRKQMMVETCTFDDPDACGYEISCKGEREYVWKRHSGATQTSGTGPSSGVTTTGYGYYLYAESTFGHKGDLTTVTFPFVKNNTDKYLRFWYHMYGKRVGSLHLQYVSQSQDPINVWTMTGNQGNKWRSYCGKLATDSDAFRFVAVRGSNHLGDIAIDQIQVNEEICPHPLTCDFEVGSCNYDFENSNGYYTWKKNEMENYMEINSTSKNKEVATSSMVSPEINGMENEGSLRFSFQMFGKQVYKLTVLSRNMDNKETNELWITNDNRATDWDEGCIDIPYVRRVQLVFMSTNGFGSLGYTRLDNITYHQQRCSRSILNCNFDGPRKCGYKIDCNSSSYKWSRAKTTPSHNTGPKKDHTGSSGQGYFMYVESSKGRVGDRAELSFPPFRSPCGGHRLLFYYNMHGRDSGELQVSVKYGPEMTYSNWSKSGDFRVNWQTGCMELLSDRSTLITFTAIRGNGPLGDMAIDDVSVQPGTCGEPTIACDFNDDFICGYKNIANTAGWQRIHTDSGSHMRSNITGSDDIILKSPLANVTDSCIQVHYSMDTVSLLEVYSNQDKKLHLLIVNGDENTAHLGQFYVDERDEISLQFKTDTNNHILITKVDILPGNCPPLNCPYRAKACRDQRYCLDKLQFCDHNKGCFDGSDEDTCPIGIACDFSTTHVCGYEKGNWQWYPQDTGYMLLGLGTYNSRYNSRILSPKQTIDDVCVRFSYRARNPVSLIVRSHYEDGGNQTRWTYKFRGNELTWRVGQFFLPRGNVQIEFQSSIPYDSMIAIDDIVLHEGDCHTIECSSEDFLCVDGQRCISKKEKCNRLYECEDKSDENDCPSSIDCDFEDNFACGYAFGNDWTLTTGWYNHWPLSDHSEGHAHGHYITAANFSQARVVHLDSPEETITITKCLTFFYSFQGTPSSRVQVFDNNSEKLVIRPFNIKTWQKSQFQLDKGVHKLRFSVSVDSPSDKFALDSVSTSVGVCPRFECEENWKRCQSDNICIPHYKFCDREDDCPNGFDEQNCETLSSLRFSMGENANQGFVESYREGIWQGVCTRYAWRQGEPKTICREIGYHRTHATYILEPQHEPTKFSNIYNVRCRGGHEDHLSLCVIDTCNNCSCHHNPLVDCSNTNCSSTQLPCPNSKVCLSKELFCDGQPDCLGGEDEKQCDKCLSNEFRCLSKECIFASQRCDGINDCKDSSDEHNCFIQNGTSFFFLHNEKYEPVCETNLNRKKIANKLCEAVGKSGATIRQSVSSGKGIEFTRERSKKNKFLPGLSPKNVRSCQYLEISCNSEECGAQGKIATDGRVYINDMSTFKGQWPWQAILTSPDGGKFCGGVLIHPRYVLTSGDCLISQLGTWIVKLGTIFRDEGSQYNVKRIIFESDQHFTRIRISGLALFELENPVEMTDHIRSVCLPTTPWVPIRECITTGWGETGSRDKFERLFQYYDPTGGNQLKESKVYLLSRDDCISHYKRIRNTTQCATSDTTKLPCMVDHGGPLVCRNQHGRWELSGIVIADGFQCYFNDVSDPVTFRDVYQSLEWIRKHLI